jgi:BirA family biotin operon repressor/biotin-[acetyl-CoA-carboxylase] ligase
MNQISLKNKLSNLNIGEIRYFDSIGSTNDEALAWAVKGAPDLSFVIADEQTAGRGRLNRKWFTPKGSALAFSLILRPTSLSHLSRTVGLAALSVADACLRHGLSPRIKWPNDILIKGKKVAGILIETVWSGSEVDSLVIGMGVNVHKDSVPPAEHLQFPATSLEHELGLALDREELLANILIAFIARRPQMESEVFLQAWQGSLAFQGEQVQVKTSESEWLTGELLGLEEDGSLRLRDEHGKTIIVRFGDVSLRPSA